MSASSNIEFLLVVIFFGVLILMAGNTIYFQIRFQKKTDQAIHGENYVDGGWLFNANRMMMYAHYCLFSARAKRAGVYEQVTQLPREIKFHLILHWVIVNAICCTVLILYFTTDWATN